MASAIEQTRLKISSRTDARKKSHLGQFFTPASTALFMVGLFPEANGECRLLDAGAGIGCLSSAFLERCANGNLNFKEIKLKTFELDASIHEELHRSLLPYTQNRLCLLEAIGNDFIEEAVNAIQIGSYDFTHAIINPPYKKIGSHSRYRLLLREVGIETVNLYSAFIALTVALAAPSGQIVAIIPRSFCNGPYYRPFRNFILERSAIHHIHLFKSRSKAFKDDSVLQENIIIQLECGGKQGPVKISTSTDDTFNDLVTHEQPFERILLPGDSERFIHIPTSLIPNTFEKSTAICYTLEDLGIKVSTGPVVDFRLKQYLRNLPESDTVPLLYPAHSSTGKINWPIVGMKKPNAIQRNVDTEKWLYPIGFYCVVRRFSSKEEKRRIMASVVNPAAFGDSSMLGFENHFNIFHENKHGLSEAMAMGLTVFLNTTAVDENFRCFNGHTQVNATDLKQMKYPNRQALISLGQWAMTQGDLTQTMMDEQLRILLA